MMPLPAAQQPLPRRSRSYSILPPAGSGTQLTAEEERQLRQLLLQLAAATPPCSSLLDLFAALGSGTGTELGVAEQQQQLTSSAALSSGTGLGPTEQQQQLASSAVQLLQALVAGQLALTARECRAAHCLLACISSAVGSLPEETHIPHAVLAEAARRGLKWNQRRRSSAADDTASLGLLFDLRPRGAAEAGMRLKVADWRWADDLEPPACQSTHTDSSGSEGEHGSGIGYNHRQAQHQSCSHSQHRHHQQRHAVHADLADACAQAAAETQAADLRAQVEALQTSLEAARAAEAAAAQQAAQQAQHAAHQAAQQARQESVAQLAAAAELAAELQLWRSRAEAAEAALAFARQRSGPAEEIGAAALESEEAEEPPAGAVESAAAAAPEPAGPPGQEQQRAEHVPLHRRRELVLMAFSTVLFLFTR